MNFQEWDSSQHTCTVPTMLSFAPPQVMAIKNLSRHCKCPLGEKWSLGVLRTAASQDQKRENASPLLTTLFKNHQLHRLFFNFSLIFLRHLILFITISKRALLSLTGLSKYLTTPSQPDFRTELLVKLNFRLAPSMEPNVCEDCKVMKESQLRFDGRDTE